MLGRFSIYAPGNSVPSLSKSHPKIMRSYRKLLFLVALLPAFGQVMAQPSLEVGLNYALPQGSFGDVYQFGVGAGVLLRYNLTEQLAIGASGSANGFGGDYQVASNPSRDVEGVVLNISGLAQYKLFDRKVSPYGELGIGLYSIKDGSINFEEYTRTFGYAPKVGVMMDLLNVSAAYHMAGEVSFLQLSLGVRIGYK